uniref:Uncharacterized protein n=1 Tax=Opuntia streptacantha TaxID=393608 RepID=A0A7C8YPR5_OPUST
MISSPILMNNGTLTVTPVSTVAGLDEPCTVSPLIPGSVSTTVSFTMMGSSRSIACPFQNRRLQSIPSFSHLVFSPTSSSLRRNSSYVFRSIKTYMEPSLYVNCFVSLDISASAIELPARKVFSTVFPVT